MLKLRNNKIDYTLKDEKLFVEFLADRLDEEINLFRTLLDVVENKKPKLIVFDMKNIQYMNSSGIAELIALYRVGRKNNVKFQVINLSSHLKKVLKIVEFGELEGVEIK